MNITIIDDNVGITKTLQDMLEHYNNEWGIRVFNTGTEALQDIPINMPDIIFIDISLPDMNGLELLKSVKEIDQDIQAIIITAYPTVDNIITALRYGALDFIRKPIHIKDIMAVLEIASEKRKLLLDSRAVVAKLIYDKENNDEIGGMFDILDKIYLISNFQKDSSSILSSHKFMEYSLSFLRELLNTECIYYYTINNEKGIRANNVNNVADLKADQMVAEHWDTLGRNGICKISDNDIISHISFENEYKGFLLFHRDYMFKYREIDYISLLSMYLGLKIAKIDTLKHTDSYMGGMILSLISSLEIEDSLMKHKIEMGTYLAVDFAQFINCDIEQIEQIRYAVFLYFYLYKYKGINNINYISKLINETVTMMNTKYPVYSFVDRITELTDQIVELEHVLSIIKYIDTPLDREQREQKLDDHLFEPQIITLSLLFTDYYIDHDYSVSDDMMKIVEYLYKKTKTVVNYNLTCLFDDFIRKHKSDIHLSIQKEGVL